MTSSRTHTEIIMFRHGNTDWNTEGRLQGTTDVPLNAKGITEAEDLAERLLPLGLEHVITSPLLRAAKTAEVVCRKLDVAFTTVADLRELDCGEAEGLTWDEVWARFGEDARRGWRGLDAMGMAFAFRGGETKASARDRAMRAVVDFARAARPATLGVSTHGAILRFATSALLPEGTPPVPVHNCAAYRMRLCLEDETWELLGPV